MENKISDDLDGGYWLPKVAFIDVERKGLLFVFIRWLGNRFIFFGHWVYSFGYKKEIIHPQKMLWREVGK